MTNDVMAKMNMKGHGGKYAFGTSKVFEIVKGVYSSNVWIIVFFY